MKNTFLSLITAYVAATVLTGCKKDNSEEENNVIRFADKNLSVAVDQTAEVKLFVPSGAGIADLKSNDAQVAVVRTTSSFLKIKVTGKKEGNTTVEVKNGNRSQKAVLNVHVFRENVENNGGFKVDKSVIFLAKNQDTDVTGHLKGGSGNYDVIIGNSNLGSVRKVNGKFIVKGLGEGISDFITFKDLTLNKTVEVPAYVIKPFKATNAPTELSLNSAYDINLEGVYTTTTTDNGNTSGRFDRVTYSTSGGVQVVQVLTKEHKNQQGQLQGHIFTGIKVKATAIGAGSVTLINGDGQTLSLNFTVKTSVVNNPYFNVNADGVLTVKPGVTLPAHVDLPLNAKKIARDAFKDKDFTSIDLKNVEEIGEKAFMGCVNLTTVKMQRVKVVKGGAFRGTALTEIDLPASIETIETGAFDITNLVKVICRATTPPSVGGSFRLTNSGQRVLYVPASSIENYVTNWNSELNSYFRGLPKRGINYIPYPIQ